jgi:hypothetical protein
MANTVKPMIHVITKDGKVIATAQNAGAGGAAVSLRARPGQVHHHIAVPAGLEEVRDPQQLHQALEKHLAMRKE